MYLAAFRICRATGFYPRLLMHWPVGVLCQELPALRFIFDSPNSSTILIDVATSANEHLIFRCMMCRETEAEEAVAFCIRR
jgi:hypothetical protein